MNRPDISDKLIHFTGPSNDWEQAYGNLKSITSGGRIVAGNGKIRGGYHCICFTEAPLPSLASGLVNTSEYSRYSPFGVMFDKTWLFTRGARPVIYQSEAEYLDLPESLRWRHVRYEPIGTFPIDFTWEREWRMPCNELLFHSSDAAIVLPNLRWAHRLQHEHHRAEDYEIELYSLLLGQLLAEQLRTNFPWRICLLGPADV